MHEPLQPMTPSTLVTGLHRCLHKIGFIVNDAAGPPSANNLLLRAALFAPLVHTAVEVGRAAYFQVDDQWVV